MKDILLTPEGDINQEAIHIYKRNHSINSPFYNHETSRDETPLYYAVTNEKIPRHSKPALIKYLINQGALINEYDTNRYGSLLGFALKQRDTSLADALLSCEADIGLKYEGKDLIDLAIESNDARVMVWVLKNAKLLFTLFEPDKFKELYVQIAMNFSSEEVMPLLKNVDEFYQAQFKAKIGHKFGQLGLINERDMALVLAAKTQTKDYPNSIFVLTKQDIPALVDSIKSLLENETEKKLIKFQTVFYINQHAMFSEFTIDKKKQPFVLRYFHCDPLPGTIAYDDVLTPDFVEDISSLADIEIFDSDYSLQKGMGCTYFALDGSMMLATPSERNYVPDVLDHINKYGVSEKTNYKEKNVSYKKSDTLPTRLIRGSHDVEDGVGFFAGIKGLNTLVFNTPEKNVIVNKKGETAEKSIRKDLQEVSSKKDPGKIYHFNLRAQRKMKQFGQAVINFLKDKNILSADFENLIDKYKMPGLKQFCDQQIRPSKRIKR